MPGPKKIELEADKRVVWILTRLRGLLNEGRGGVELTTVFDEGMEFLADFSAAFPGRKNDPNYVMAKERAYRLLKRMEARGWVRSEIASNYDLMSRHEPKWVTEWKLTSRGADYLRGLNEDGN